jgi:hypothetical protein
MKKGSLVYMIARRALRRGDQWPARPGRSITSRSNWVLCRPGNEGAGVLLRVTVRPIRYNNTYHRQLSTMTRTSDKPIGSSAYMHPLRQWNRCSATMGLQQCWEPFGSRRERQDQRAAAGKRERRCGLNPVCFPLGPIPHQRARRKRDGSPSRPISRSRSDRTTGNKPLNLGGQPLDIQLSGRP